MFKLTLQDIALGWFETESPNWLTEDQMKQAFLKRFNPWGDTRHQQQDAWNKLKFDMTKDDVDVFVVDMKMLASILSYDEVIMEKFKDIFPDPNIEAALIAMDNFAAMQTKAKQLVQIYKPKHDSTMASAAILVHNADNSYTKNENLLPKSNQHQLPPIHPTQSKQIEGMGSMEGDKVVEYMVSIADHMAGEAGETLIATMINRIMDKAMVKEKETFRIIETEVKIDHFQVGEDTGITLTLIIKTGTIGIEMEVVKVTIIIIGAEDGKVVEVKVKMTEEEGENGILTPSTHNNTTRTQIIIDRHQWVSNTDTQYRMNNILHIHLSHNIQHKDRRLNHGRLQIYANCVKIKA